MLVKAGIVARGSCIPYLASVKANNNCKVDMGLRRVEGLVVKIPSPDKALRGDHTRGDDLAREAPKQILFPLLRKGVNSVC